MWSVPPVEVSVEERAELERRVRAKTSTQRQAQRARIILLACEGVPNRQIAAEVAMSEQYVGIWRRRFVAERLAGLEDKARPGRPRLYGHDERLAVVAKATAERPALDSQWSHRSLSEALVEIGISASQIGRILAELDIKPHQVRGWLTRREDPSFWERAGDVCALYLSPPTNAIVLSVDEKTGIGARSRKHPGTAAGPGRPERREFEYLRHGTASIIAALDVHSGNVVAKDIARNDSVSFTSFLAEIEEKIDPGLEIHLILDNGSSHVAKATKAWLATRPRFVVHHTPTHASWLNQVELVFSILTRRLLKRGDFSSRDDLVAKIMAWIEEYSRTAKPFAWTYDAKPLKVA
jgi:transposase